MTATKLFLEKYGNKITASESWVIRFAEEYAKQEVNKIKRKVKKLAKDLKTTDGIPLDDIYNDMINI